MSEWIGSSKAIVLYRGEDNYSKDQIYRFVKRLKSLNVPVRKNAFGENRIQLKALKELIKNEIA